MTVHVLLIDDNDNTILVRCADNDAAEALGSSAVYSDGGVSAYVVPTLAINDSEALHNVLRAGGPVSLLHDMDNWGEYNLPADLAKPDVEFTPMVVPAPVETLPPIPAGHTRVRVETACNASLGETWTLDIDSSNIDPDWDERDWAMLPGTVVKVENSWTSNEENRVVEDAETDVEIIGSNPA